MGWLRDRYPELYTSGEPRRSMGHFDLLLTVARGLRGGRSVAFFSLAGGAATELALRLHRDDQLRRRVAEALGATLERFDGEAPAVIRDAHSFPGGFTDNGEVASALETGSRF
jgi:hypothetical protein